MRTASRAGRAESGALRPAAGHTRLVTTDGADPVSDLVGRDLELESLLHALERARRRESATVLVSGEAGVGKSRLVREFGQRAHEERARVLVGECVEFGQDGRPYAPFASIVRRLVRDVGVGRVLEWAGSTGDELVHLVPQMGASAASGREVTRRRRLQLALTTLIESCARTQPVVLVLEDLHWADRSTRAFLPELLHATRDLAVVTIMTVRSDELTAGSHLARTLAELVRGAAGSRLHVPPLSRDEQERQLAQLQGDPVGDEVVERVFARTRGNPFFAEELVAAGIDGALPDSVRDLLLHRVVGLPRRSRDLLRVIAVAGDPCPHWLAAAAAGIAPGDVDEVLRPAIEAHVMVADPDGVGYGFRHPLLREATIQTILPGERRRVHLAVARAVERVGSEGAAPDLAHHWREAGDLRRALPAFVAAARSTAAIGAYPEALAHYEQALRLWHTVPDAITVAETTRHAVRAEAAEVAVWHGEYATAGALQQQALDDLDVDSDPATASAYYANLGDMQRLMGDGDGSQAAYERAVELAPADDDAVRAVAISGLARSRMLTGRHAEAVELASVARDLARGAGLLTVEAQALLTLGASQSFHGDPDGGLATTRAGQRAALASGDEAATIRSYVNLTALVADSGKLTEIPALFAEAGDVLGSHVQGHAQWKCLRVNAVEALLLLGRWDELTERVAEILIPDPNGLENLEACGLMARFDMEQGRLDQAAEGIARACDWVVGTREPQLIGPVWAAAAELACWQHDGWRALQVAEAGWDHLAAPDSHHGLDLAAAAVHAADLAARAARNDEHVAEALRAAERWYGRACSAACGPMGGSILVRTQRQRVEAEIASLRGGPSADLWDATARAWDTQDRPTSVAYSRWRQAEALLIERGDRDAAASALRDAHEIAQRLGAVTVDDEIQQLARRARLDIGTALTATGTTSAIADLTQREYEVLELVAEGLTNFEIAQRLFVSARTVSTHVSNILAKVGARTRTEAAAMLHATTVG